MNASNWYKLFIVFVSETRGRWASYCVFPAAITSRVHV